MFYSLQWCTSRERQEGFSCRSTWLFCVLPCVTVFLIYVWLFLKIRRMGCFWNCGSQFKASYVPPEYILRVHTHLPIPFSLSLRTATHELKRLTVAWEEVGMNHWAQPHESEGSPGYPISAILAGVCWLGECTQAEHKDIMSDLQLLQVPKRLYMVQLLLNVSLFRAMK